MVDKQLDETADYVGVNIAKSRRIFKEHLPDIRNIGTFGQRVGIKVAEVPIAHTVDNMLSVDKNQ